LGNIYLIDVLVATESGDFEIAWSAVMLCCNTISRSRDFFIVVPEIILDTIVSFSFYSTIQTILLSQNLSLKNLALYNNNWYIQELSDLFIQLGLARPTCEQIEQIYEFSTPKIFGATYKLSTLAASG
jgi:hypothetical protein